MTEYWPFLAAGICVLAVVRCADARSEEIGRAHV